MSASRRVNTAVTVVNAGVAVADATTTAAAISYDAGKTVVNGAVTAGEAVYSAAQTAAPVAGPAVPGPHANPEIIASTPLP